MNKFTNVAVSSLVALTMSSAAGIANAQSFGPSNGATGTATGQLVVKHTLASSLTCNVNNLALKVINSGLVETNYLTYPRALCGGLAAFVTMGSKWSITPVSATQVKISTGVINTFAAHCQPGELIADVVSNSPLTLEIPFQTLPGSGSTVPCEVEGYVVVSNLTY